MKELLVLGYKRALSLKEPENIYYTMENKDDNELFTACKKFIRSEGEAKLSGISTKLDERNPMFVLGTLSLFMPVMLYTQKSKNNPHSKSKYVSNAILESNLICNNLDWVKRIGGLSRTSTVLPEEIDEMVAKVGQKIAKNYETIIQDLLIGVLRGIVISKNETSIKGTYKRTPFQLYRPNTFGAPFIYMWGYALGLKKLAETKLIRINYRKLDGNLRQHVVSSNIDLINKVYDNYEHSKLVQQIALAEFNFRMLNQNLDLGTLRGLYTAPDLNIPINDTYPKRRVSIMGIQSVEDLTENEDAIKKLNMQAHSDILNVYDNFMSHIAKMSEDGKNKVIDDLKLNPDVPISQAINMNLELGTTEYSIFLHEYMLSQPALFIGYTGLIQNRSMNTASEPTVASKSLVNKVFSLSDDEDEFVL